MSVVRGRVEYWRPWIGSTNLNFHSGRCPSDSVGVCRLFHDSICRPLRKTLVWNRSVVVNVEFLRPEGSLHRLPPSAGIRFFVPSGRPQELRRRRPRAAAPHARVRQMSNACAYGG